MAAEGNLVEQALEHREVVLGVLPCRRELPPAGRASEHVPVVRPTGTAGVDVTRHATRPPQQLLGRRPFEGTDTAAVMYKILNEEPVPAQQDDKFGARPHQMFGVLVR